MTTDYVHVVTMLLVATAVKLGLVFLPLLLPPTLLVSFPQVLVDGSLTLDSLFTMSTRDLRELLQRREIPVEDTRKLMSYLDFLTTFYGKCTFRVGCCDPTTTSLLTWLVCFL